MVNRSIFLFVLWCVGWLCQVQGQTRADYFFLEAEKCRLAGDYSSAMELYQHCLEINPSSPAALHNLGLIYMYLRQDSIGTDMLRRACELDERNPWYLESLASIYLSRRATHDAISILEKMAQIQTRRSDVLSQLATIYRTVEQHDKAIEALNRIELLEGKSAQLSHEKYTIYMEKGARDSAFMELQALCDEFPHDMNYRVLLASKYQTEGDTVKALGILDYVRQRDPNNMSLHTAMLDYYHDTKQQARYDHLRDSLLFAAGSSVELRVELMRSYIEDAQRDTTLVHQVEQTFDVVLAQPQHDIKMLTLKAAYQIYRKVDERDVAATMQRILEVEPGAEVAMSWLLRYYSSRMDYVSLEDICRRGVNYYPEELAYAYFLGITLYQQDKEETAMEVLQQGLRTRTEEASPGVVSDMFGILGDIYYQQHRPEEAFAAYDSALVYRDDNISCLNNYAYYLSLREQQLDKAEEMSYRTIKAEPANITYLDTYAWILFMKQDYKGARLYIDQVVRPLRPDEEVLADAELQGNVIEHAGDIYALCEEMEQALRLWQLAAAKKDNTATPLLKKKIKKKRYIK